MNRMLARIAPAMAPLFASSLARRPRASPGAAGTSGLREATRSQRPVLVDVYTDWCGWCKRMDKDVYARPDVRDYLSRRFVAVKLRRRIVEPRSVRREAPHAALAGARRFRVTGYPTTVFLRPDGERLANVPGYLPAEPIPPAPALHRRRPLRARRELRGFREGRSRQVAPRMPTLDGMCRCSISQAEVRSRVDSAVIRQHDGPLHETSSRRPQAMQTVAAPDVGQDRSELRASRALRARS